MPDDWRFWAALRPDGRADSIFQTREWLAAWTEVFGSSRQFWTLGVRDGDTIVGLAQLMLQQTDRGHRELQFAAGTHSDYGDFLCAGSPAQPLEAIGRVLREHGADWDSFYVRNVPTQSPTFTALPAAMRAAGLHCFHESLVSCPALLLDAGRGAAILGKYSVRRPLQRLQRAGRVNFKLLGTPAEIGSYLPLFFAQHQQRWRSGAVRSPFADARYRSWFEALALVMQERGWLHFSVLELDALPVAFHFGFRHGGKLVWYKPSYSVEHASLSPGIALVAYLIRDALDSGCTEFDFTIGNEPFKQRFANVERSNANFRVFHDRRRYGMALAGGLLHSAYSHGRSAVRRLLRGQR